MTYVKLACPVIPFITEEIYQTLLDDGSSIMVSDWPVYSQLKSFPEEEKQIEKIKEAVSGIRNIRGEMNVPPSRKAKVFVVSEDDSVRANFEDNLSFFATLGLAGEVVIQSDKTGIEDNAVSVVIENATIYMPFADLVDIEKEKERLQKEEKRLVGELARSEKMLSNPGFTSKAPKEKIEEEKVKQEKYKSMLDQVRSRLENL